ncbi:uncharacterized protein LOC119448875 isoform X4 [Dermacentor silvarum]|uniref:uncharacterized protein LOC119448875 isoform X1 n=1 Tax=Dermacentor silvarum TaxID=543639 RepID=UPI00189C121F|nr:uncharacterized protein LOC119448875 isoform X1 [Dermacentor silvarum]XP_049521990.1 uncharacterized protein LOC119448875 isoform X2 [Dermacentor silvarum]XP_049521991.1 uncharacterized protein LOC119448875 isoform X3 [Dermacentor silvarum]XP_049521992.1 uncharacterized protein LOC119448875 isoform X4 [Dermacentor silvarum]
MPFQLKEIIMRDCQVAVVLVTLTHVAVDAGILSSMMAATTALRRPALPKMGGITKSLQKVGSVAKEQHIDPHIDSKIDVMLDMAPGPNDAIDKKPEPGYNGTGISGAPRSKGTLTTQLQCGDCSCKLPIDIADYGPKQGCTAKVQKLICSCKRSSCSINQVAKCLQTFASDKCKQNDWLRATCY